MSIHSDFIHNTCNTEKSTVMQLRTFFFFYRHQSESELIVDKLRSIVS